MRLTLAERVAKLENWTEMHPETHRLEAEALRLAGEFTAVKMHDLNNLRAACVEKSWFEKVHDILESRVKTLEDARNERLGERHLFKYLWQALMFGLGWLVHYLWK
jgi:hypothetical protein